MSLIPILDIVGKVVERVIPDPNQRLQLQLELSKLADQEAMRESNERIAQAQTNNVQAANPSLFVSGPRPALMWCGVAALVWEGFAGPLLGTMGATITHVPAGVFDSILLFTAGLCGIRGFEKVKGVARDTLTENVEQPQPVAAKKKKGPKIIPDWLR